MAIKPLNAINKTLVFLGAVPALLKSEKNSFSSYCIVFISD